MFEEGEVEGGWVVFVLEVGEELGHVGEAGGGGVTVGIVMIINAISIITNSIITFITTSCYM